MRESKIRNLARRLAEEYESLVWSEFEGTKGLTGEWPLLKEAKEAGLIEGRKRKI